MSRSPAAGLAENSTIKSMIIRRGVAGVNPRRFIAGEHLHEALQAVKTLGDKASNVSLDYLGENFTTSEDTDAGVAAYVEAIKAVASFYPDSLVSVKLTAIGLATSPQLAYTNFNNLLAEAAGRGDVFLRIDMEGSQYVDDVIKIARQAHSVNSNVGTALASHLRRTDRDLDDVINDGIPIRLVRGAYDEPAKLVYTRKDEIDAAYRRQMFRLLDSPTYHTIANHDPEMVESAKLYTKKRNIEKNSFEFEFPLGGNPKLQQELMAEGYRVRVNIPYGEAWYPYFVRCLGESPVSPMGLILGLFR